MIASFRIRLFIDFSVNSQAVYDNNDDNAIILHESKLEIFDYESNEFSDIYQECNSDIYQECNSLAEEYTKYSVEQEDALKEFISFLIYSEWMERLTSALFNEFLDIVVNKKLVLYIDNITKTNNNNVKLKLPQA